MRASRLTILTVLGVLSVPAVSGVCSAKPTPLGTADSGQQLAQAGDTVTPFWLQTAPPAPAEATEPQARTETVAEPPSAPQPSRAPSETRPVPDAAASGRPPVRTGVVAPPARKPGARHSSAESRPPQTKPGETRPPEAKPAEAAVAPGPTPVPGPEPSGTASAAEGTAQPRPPSPAPPTGDRPILRADEVVFDEDLGLITATGRVELSRAAESVYADTISYNLRTEIVTATGNVRLFQENGDIIFSDYAELTADLRNAFIDQASVLFANGERMAGNEAEQTEGRFLRVSRGVFSPCNLCKEDPEAPPIWQIRAEKIVRDKEDLEVRYKNMSLDIFGVPVFWTPYFSHADPTVDRKTGFLAPTWGNSADFGYFLANYYYIDLEPNRDATLGLAVFQDSFPLFSAEVRNRFERGYLNVFGALTYESVENLETSGQQTENDQLRGSLSGQAEYHFDENWRAGGTLEAASDYNFHRQYLTEPDENFLESRGYVEGFFDRDYASLEVLRFQSILPEESRGAPEPIVFPLLQYQMVGAPGEALGGNWSLDLGLRGISRDQEGTDSNRFSVQPEWQRRFIYGPGLVTDLTTQVRADAYAFAERDNGERNTNSAFRLVPRGQILNSYPLVRLGEDYDHVLVPTVGLTASTDQDDDPEFPIEDGRDAELRATNLFSLNRYLSNDLQEGGVNAVYGTRYGITRRQGGQAQVFLGQNYRLQGDNDLGSGSGFDETRSDYVGYVDLQPTRWLDLYYDFRHDRETLDRERQTIQVSLGGPPFTVSSSYDYLVGSEGGTTGEREEQEYVTFAINSQISQYWSVGIGHAQTLAPENRALSTRGTLTYRDECLDFSALVTRDNSDLPGLSNEISVTFRVVLKHIGEISLRNISTSLLGGGGDSRE